MHEDVRLEKIVGGGQALGVLADGRKCFVWGGLPEERVRIRITKKKSKMVEGVVEAVLDPSAERIEPKESGSYLSTSPWQIMNFEAEQTYKARLIEEAFTLHGVRLPHPTTLYSDTRQFGYRNKVEFSWYGDTTEDGNETLDLAFFKRGSKGKVVVEGTSLAREEINILAREIRDILRAKQVPARELKTLLIRCDQQGVCVWQLYVKSCELRAVLTPEEAARLSAQGGEIIYSDPRSPASRITERLARFGVPALTDTILDISFRYATEGFFQVNLPVYEEALRDMKKHTPKDRAVIDMYAGVGTIGLTIGDSATLVEINEDAVREMHENITRLNANATAVHAASEQALEYITEDTTLIVDPPRAGLHSAVVQRILVAPPSRILYLSCNPVTQARDVALLLGNYSITAHRGYNFFPRTPHIEHLVVLDKKN
jgi:23S rRNA (uracil1939-C5)-methyltransferase